MAMVAGRHTCEVLKGWPLTGGSGRCGCAGAGEKAPEDTPTEQKEKGTEMQEALFKGVPDELYNTVLAELMEMRGKHPEYRDDTLLMRMICDARIAREKRREDVARGTHLEGLSYKGENRIARVTIADISTGEGTPSAWMVTSLKEFAPQHGGGYQAFYADGGPTAHHALEVALGMVTLSPRERSK